MKIKIKRNKIKFKATIEWNLLGSGVGGGVGIGVGGGASKIIC